MKVYIGSKDEVIVEDNSFARGGEGEVHKILSPSKYKNSCIKIYKPDIRELKKEKILFMIRNVPNNIVETRCMLCWPQEMVYDNNGLFLGYLMPIAFENSIVLYSLCLPKLSKNLKQNPLWRKFDRENTDIKEQLVLRLKICVNIAIAINKIHQTGKYVLVDSKPENMLISSEGKISLVDMDSIQISENGKIIQKASACTIDYAPPESIKIDFPRQRVDITWDLFSIPIIFYQVLFGLHPYAASTNSGKYSSYTEISQLISNGLFVHGSKNNYLNASKLHEKFNFLSDKLKSLFILTFDKSFNEPDKRPKIEVWGEALFKEINYNVNIKNLDDAKVNTNLNSNHIIANNTQRNKPQDITTNNNHANNSVDFGDLGWGFLNMFKRRKK